MLLQNFHHYLRFNNYLKGDFQIYFLTIDFIVPHYICMVLNWEQIFPPGENWQWLETFLMSRGGVCYCYVMVLGQVLLKSILLGTGYPPSPQLPTKNDPVQAVNWAEIEKPCYRIICRTANWPSSFEGLINASNSVIKMKCITFSFPRLPSMSDHSLSLASMIFINYDSFCNEVRSSKSENWVSIFFFFTKSQQQIEEKGLKISWPVSLSLPWSGSYILGNLFPIFYSSLGSSVLPRSHSCSSPG